MYGYEEIWAFVGRCNTASKITVRNCLQGQRSLSMKQCPERGAIIVRGRLQQKYC
jgi:hypothetical protein